MTELVGFRQAGDNTGLIARITVAVAVKAHADAQKAWAIKALTSPRVEAETVANYVLAANKDATRAAFRLPGGETLPTIAGEPCGSAARTTNRTGGAPGFPVPSG